MQLLGKWTSLGQGHILLGGNCSCGLVGGSLPIADFEQQILDYLNGKYAYERGRAASLGELLRAIAAQPADADSGQWLSLLDDLKRTLESFDEQHRAR